MLKNVTRKEKKKKKNDESQKKRKELKLRVNRTYSPHTYRTLNFFQKQEKPRTLEAKFTTRYMYEVTMDEDERMKSEYWDEIANIYNPQDDDLVKVDLIAMAGKYAVGFDLQDALDKSNPDLPEDFKVG